MKIFFSGIGGSGVSAIAGFMAEKGNCVAGSDRLFDEIPSHPLRMKLQKQGIAILPQNGQGIDSACDLTVFSTSVERSNPDFIRSLELGIPMKSRPDYLSEIVSCYKTVAVAGTSGKSTTSGMLAFLMERLGLSPNFIGGGRVKQFRNMRNAGNYLSGSSETLIIEACESDGSIVNYRPEHSLILNLELDHHSVSETAGMFERLADNTRGLVLVNADDRNLSACSISGGRGFSIYADSDYKAAAISCQAMSTSFQVNGQDFRLSLPGEYNLCNALACISFLSEIGTKARDIAEVLPEFEGIERRFDIHLDDGRYMVIDDYAHNPHKLASLMAAMKKISQRICYIFQPHGFGPTRLMKDGYIRTFVENLRPSDHLILLPIYYAGGTAAKDISSSDLAAGIAAAGRSVEVITERSEVLERTGIWDCYVVAGARDDTLSDLAGQIAGKLG